MSNLFSIFDPTSSIMKIQLNWLSSIMGLTLIPMTFWLMNNRFEILMKNISSKLNKEFNLLLNKSNNQGTSLMMISLLIMIAMNNFMGLFPYVFTSTSHLIMSLTLSLPLWLTLMIFGWTKNTENMFSHLVPSNTPFMLMSFMVCIETISNLIRPGTLAVRLTANMIAGHLLITLLSSTTMVVSSYIMTLMIIIQMILLMLEVAVAFIQSYVFAVLSTLYTSEVN
nr:ATP synthase F0 subunit 6 [Nanhuaphasma hamicercum]